MKTIYGANRLQRIQYGNYATTIPATWHYALHMMNVLSADVAISDTICSLEFAPALGGNIIFEPGTPDAEERTVTGVTGGGPYNVTFAVPLTKAHTATDEVLSDPGFSAESVEEFSGGSYARAAHTNNSTNYGDASGGQSSNLVVVSFPAITATLGKATHLLQYDASSAGNCWEWWRLVTPILLDTGESPKVNVGQLISLVRGALS